MIVTLAGIMRPLKEKQSQNALSPMLVTPSGIIRLLKDLQQEYLLLVDYQYYTL